MYYLDTIKICDNPVHQRQIPLVSTFAFPGCELWCPCCGMAGGILGTGLSVPDTPDLAERLDELERRSYSFLSARGKLVADRIAVDGVMLHRTEVPDHVYQEARAVVDAWTLIDESTIA